MSAQANRIAGLQNELYPYNGSNGVSHSQEPSLGELFSDLAQETRSLLHDELQLAKAELKESTAHVASNAGKIGVGGVLLHLSLYTFTGTLILLLATFLPAWVAGLIVTVLLGGVGMVMLKGGLAGLKKVELAPKQTIQSLQEDARCLTGKAS